MGTASLYYAGAYSIAAGAWSTAAIAGAAAGAVSGGIMGGFRGAVVGGLSGFAFAAGNAVWSGVGNSLVRGAGQAATAGAIGGGSSEALGGRFQDGFKFAFAASAASSIYQSVVRYGATWEPGGSAVDKSQNQHPVRWANNWGTQGSVARGGFWIEGGPLSRIANRIPGMNAIAGMHDEFVTHISGSTWRNLLNVPLMPPAVAVAIPALGSTTPGVFQAYTQIRMD